MAASPQANSTVVAASAPLHGPVAVLINAAGGAAARLGRNDLYRRIVSAFARHDMAVEPVFLGSGDMAGAIEAALAASQDLVAVVAGGGDGTINAVAQHLAGSAVPLGILPLGTYNHFARDLGIPLDIDGAVATIAAGHASAVDLGEVNERIFANNSSIGFYPELVRDRDRQRRKSRRQKWLAALVALFHVLRHLPRRRLRIEAEGWVEPRRTPFAFVGNNLYSTDLFAPRHRRTLSGGELCLFVASPDGLFGIVRMLLRAALGRLDEDSDFESRRLRALTIQSHRRHHKVSLDGEVVILRPPLRYRIRPRALRVLVPATEPDA
ncbi:MAG: diacylglycerol kinase family lipid kinase [Alphaproteobacteria bacterium]|nr:diacylglycerol kinase family lipid kinase [Alphaproteobacteria bacterium]